MRMLMLMVVMMMMVRIIIDVLGAHVSQGMSSSFRAGITISPSRQCLM